MNDNLPPFVQSCDICGKEFWVKCRDDERWWGPMCLCSDCGDKMMKEYERNLKKEKRRKRRNGNSNL
jgi:hypothetical protein